jgi:hypothetical protein
VEFGRRAIGAFVESDESVRRRCGLGAITAQGQGSRFRGTFSELTENRESVESLKERRVGADR